MDWSKEKVLVTGAGGFIGSHLAERLVEIGASVRAMVHYNALGRWGWLDSSDRKNEMEVVAGDITDRDSVGAAMEGVGTVFHLAALIAIPYSYRAPMSYVRTNIEGTMHVLEYARRLGVHRVVHTSTSEVYGTARQVPIPETHPLQGQSPYSASKIGADKMAEAFACSYDVPVVTVRPFNTFGPRQSARAVIPTIIGQCLAGRERIELGKLSPTRDMNYVANTVEGFVAAGSAKGAVGMTVNLGSGHEISIGDLAETIKSITGSKAEIVSRQERTRPDKSEVERLLADNRLAKEILGWEPVMTLEEGLEKTVEWMRDNMELYRTDEYVV
jgi:NAD dependent epimerase/dehydratase